MWLARISCVNVDAKYGKRLKHICLDISLLRKDIHLFGANMGVILDVPYCSIPPDINPFQHLHMVYCSIPPDINPFQHLHMVYCSIPPDINPFHHLHMVCTLLQYTPWHKPLPTPTHGLLQYNPWHKPLPTPTHGLFKQLKWLSFSDRCQCHTSIQVYKTLNNMAPS